MTGQRRRDMTNWISRIMPRDEELFPLLAEHAAALTRGAEALATLLADEGEADGSPDALRGVVEDGRQIAGTVLDRVRGSFVTPFDRTSIKALTSRTQSALTGMLGVARVHAGLDGRRPDLDLRAFSRVITDSARELERAVGLLEEVDKHADELRGMRDTVGAARVRTDELRDDAQVKLLRADPAAALAGLTLLDRLAAVVGTLDDLADGIDDLVLDHV